MPLRHIQFLDVSLSTDNIDESAVLLRHQEERAEVPHGDFQRLYQLLKRMFKYDPLAGVEAPQLSRACLH